MQIDYMRDAHREREQVLRRGIRPRLFAQKGPEPRRGPGPVVRVWATLVSSGRGGRASPWPAGPPWGAGVLGVVAPGPPSDPRDEGFTLPPVARTLPLPPVVATETVRLEATTSPHAARIGSNRLPGTTRSTAGRPHCAPAFSCSPSSTYNSRGIGKIGRPGPFWRNAHKRGGAPRSPARRRYRPPVRSPSGRESKLGTCTTPGLRG